MQTLKYTAVALYTAAVVGVAYFTDAPLRTVYPTLLLLVCSLLTHPRLIWMALGLATLGDVAAETGHFFYQLVAFACSYVTLCAFLLQQPPHPMSRRCRWAANTFLAVVALVGTYIVVAIDHWVLEGLIFVYISCLTALCYLAFCSGNRWFMVGTVLYMVSDVFIGLERFVAAIPNVWYYMYVPYYVALGIIYLSSLRFLTVKRRI